MRLAVNNKWGLAICLGLVWLFRASPAYALPLTGISYGESGSVVGTYAQASQSDFTLFTPATAVSAGSTVTLTFPSGTNLSSGNIAVGDFTLAQASDGLLCINAGADTAPSGIAVNSGNRTITLTLASASLSTTVAMLPCGLGQVTIKTTGTIGGNEIRHPTAATTTGTYQIDTSVGDTGSINNVTFIPDTAASLRVTGSATMTAGGNNELTITAYDQYSNVVSSGSNNYTGAKSLTFSGPGTAPDGTAPTVEGTTIGSATSVSFTNGVSNTNAATLVAYKAETTTVDVSDGSINSTGNTGYDLDLVVNPASGAILVFTTQPSSSATAGTNFATQPVVTVRDEYDNTANSSASITLAAVLASDDTTAGGGTLNATTNPLSASAGVATFAGVNYTKAETIKLKATATGLTQALSSSITVSAGSATTLTKTSGDNQIGKGTMALASPLVVTVTDAFANSVSGTEVSFSFSSVPAGATGQSLSPTSGTGNGSGQVSTNVTLGNQLGDYLITAASSGLTSVTFTATVNEVPFVQPIIAPPSPDPPGPPQCSNQAVGSAPQIIGATVVDSDSLTLYFTAPDAPYDGFVLAYGEQSGEYIYGANDLGREVRSYTINFLDPAKTYYFRLRANFGCAPGSWSEEFAGRTSRQGVTILRTRLVQVPGLAPRRGLRVPKPVEILSRYLSTGVVTPTPLVTPSPTPLPTLTPLLTPAP